MDPPNKKSSQSRQFSLQALGLALERLPQDWQARYGHPVWLAESFVGGVGDRGREQDCATAHDAGGGVTLLTRALWLCAGLSRAHRMLSLKRRRSEEIGRGPC